MTERSVRGRRDQAPRLQRDCGRRGVERRLTPQVRRNVSRHRTESRDPREKHARSPGARRSRIADAQRRRASNDRWQRSSDRWSTPCRNAASSRTRPSAGNADRKAERSWASRPSAVLAPRMRHGKRIGRGGEGWIGQHEQGAMLQRRCREHRARGRLAASVEIVQKIGHVIAWLRMGRDALDIQQAGDARLRVRHACRYDHVPVVRACWPISSASTFCASMPPVSMASPSARVAVASPAASNEVTALPLPYGGGRSNP